MTVDSLFKFHLGLLPPQAVTEDSNRLAVAYFAICGLELSGALPDVRPDILNSWARTVALNLVDYMAFRGSWSMNVGAPCVYDCPDIMGTLFALQVLTLLARRGSCDANATLQSINTAKTADWLRKCVQPDGSVAARVRDDGTPISEVDLRFTYAACAVQRLLHIDALDGDKIAAYIARCVAFDGGIGAFPGTEGHAGTTFCGLAALRLLDRDLTALPFVSTKRFLLNLQGSGFCGRIGKLEDTCYSFWVGGSLALLEIDRPPASLATEDDFLRRTEDKLTGGHSPHPDGQPDVMHSCLALAALALRENRFDPLTSLPTRDTT
ncbi:hypothetical protein CANCADRAFT_4248 [Tortispora caseinolytica NRRL Y-17796]|uniref:Prenyltransferase alpha-alpha toroid domain-containing protein n=1 Tax=Tortispora caseinolytica NRRL Y-17796 TaxID=767744 RepID=A0A1E4TD94_9ASCO|nr:hypothetical protein CANCADRAFT_4248 [Tortispora caseinolytica NRRL Y-17796]